MSIVPFNCEFHLGHPPYRSFARVDYTIDAADEKVAQIFRIPKSGNIDRVSFRVHTVSNSQTIRVGLETLNSSGDPTGTQYGGSTPGTRPSPSPVQLYEVTLVGPATAVAGDVVAAVFQFDSTVGNLSISSGDLGSLVGNSYVSHYTGSWTKYARDAMISIRYDDGTYGSAIGMPAYLYNALTINSTSNPDEVANKIVLPCPVRACGMVLRCDADNAVQGVLYDENSVALETVDFSTTARPNSSNNLTLLPFDARILQPGTYYMALKPTSSSSVGYYQLQVISQEHWETTGGGQHVYWSQRTDGGAWTDSTNKRLVASLLIDGIESGGLPVIRRGGLNLRM